MIYISYFILIFLAIRMLISIVNFLSFRYLPAKIDISTFPKVSVLIPARNEEQNIGVLLSRLTRFSYTPLEIIIYDDNSDDKTSEIVKQYVEENHHVSLISGDELPETWLGKNFACHRLAEEAEGDIFLFLDADVMVKDGLIERSLHYFQAYHLHLLSIFPKQIFKTIGEKISVPLMNWILLSFLPLIFVRISKNPAFSAANGQFMMFRADTYRKYLPHEIYKSHKVEDIAIMQYYKKHRLVSDTLLGDNYISCRMYTGTTEAINGFTKNIFQFFGNSILLTILVGLITTLGPFIIFYYFGIIAGIIYLFGTVFIRIMVSLASRQSVFDNLLNAMIQHMIFLVIIVKGIANINKKQLIWKGRNILQN